MWTDLELRKFLSYLMNHVVGIIGNYEYTGEQNPESRAYAYTGCVVASATHWHVLTAGHAIKEHKYHLASSSIRITGQVLADGFGSAVQRRRPIPFDTIGRVDHFEYQSGGLDYAIYTLTRDESSLLSGNGIKPFPFRDKPLTETTFDSYFIVGFPLERTDAAPALGNRGGVGMEPNAIPVRPVEHPSAKGRLAFQISDKGTLESIVGLSGGPVFGIRQIKDEALVHLLAIQSTWDFKSVAFSCKIEDVFRDFQNELARRRTLYRGSN